MVVADQARAIPQEPCMIAFVNTGSGSNHGAKVLELLQAALGEDRVYDIKREGGPERGLDRWASNPAVEVRVLVAGGDGTFSWVATYVDKKNLSNVRLIIVPLGSGNDMSRALGWGRKYPGEERVLKWLDWAKRAPAHSLDVWRLKAIEDTSSSSPHGTQDDDGLSHGARPLVCNYLSLGADAFVELRFNQLRWAAPEKYTSRLGNFKAHIVVGTKYTLGPTKIRITDHVEYLKVDDKPVNIPKSIQALIFLNIPSYGAGTQPWGLPRSSRNSRQTGAPRPMVVNDHIFEVIGLKSLNQYGVIKMFHTHGVRICQGSKMELKLRSPRTPFQVDGEPWEQRGGLVTMSLGNPVGVLHGPVYYQGSRKNALFDPASDNSLVRHDDCSTDGTYVRDPVHEILEKGDHARLASSFG